MNVGMKGFEQLWIILSWGVPFIGVLIVGIILLKVKRNRGPKFKKMTNGIQGVQSSVKDTVNDDFFDSEFD